MHDYKQLLKKAIVFLEFYRKNKAKGYRHVVVVSCSKKKLCRLSFDYKFKL